VDNAGLVIAHDGHDEVRGGLGHTSSLG
jgi:hypothetical protein